MPAKAIQVRGQLRSAPRRDLYPRVADHYWRDEIRAGCLYGATSDKLYSAQEKISVLEQELKDKDMASISEAKLKHATIVSPRLSRDQASMEVR